ncbi:helix-turn-helix domain-containing protein [Alteriqipengyuania lutimaris]|uniref:helix-turn-helix domain-containing protein n=2 Tax=Alteriqipengyuania lutimaris TaxID=1538146 RepID=UPI0018F8C256|nr:helix-turn-helix domain-containing protein [Alteriqipengyuania lutimaris]
MVGTPCHPKDEKESMSAHRPIHPPAAIKLVAARDLDAAETLLADFAAAGLIKTYALIREIRPHGGLIETIRDSQIPTAEWVRIIASDNVSAALNGGTVRLEEVPVQGGIPSVQITGISFSETSLVKVLDRYCANSPANVANQSLSRSPKATLSGSPSGPPKCEPAIKVVSAIEPGDLTASIAKVQKATGLGRTTIDKLMRNGTLHRIKVGRRTLITVDSIERYLGTTVR